MTSKYDPLGPYLASRQSAEVPMSFREIEEVIGVPLPPKAAQHPAWWSNNTSNNTMTKVWMEAGFRTERVDIGARRLVFRRVGGPLAAAPGDAPRRRPACGARAPQGGLLARVRAVFPGSVHIAEGVDLTAPTGEAWDAETS